MPHDNSANPQRPVWQKPNPFLVKQIYETGTNATIPKLHKKTRD